MLIVRESHSVKAVGLQELYGQRNFSIPFVAADLENVAVELAERLVTYIRESRRTILPGEKMSWATSVLRFAAGDPGLVVEALNVESDEFEHSVDSVLRNWIDQRTVCSDASSDYVSTQLSDMIVVSPEVEQGGAIVEALRYPFEQPNSGWWLFGSEYDGDVSRLRRVHVGHITKSQPGIVKYLALAPGYCISRASTDRVWFDENVAKEPVT